jgi:hypothetical protein
MLVSLLSLRVYSSVFYDDEKAMKLVADWIRKHTPDWTDDQRYETLTFWHKLLQPGTIAGFMFGPAWIRFLILVLHSIVIFTQVAYRDCLIYRVEREFSNKKIKTVVSHLLRALGLHTLKQSEKSMFTAGLNTGVLIMFVMILLQENILWMVGVALVVFTVPPILWWFSTILPPLETSSQPPENVLASPTGPTDPQTPSPVVEYTGSTGGTE